MKEVNILLIGTSPILCRNPRLADPDDEWSKLIKAITDKRVKTEEDRREIARLEWLGSLYTAKGVEGPVYPAANVVKCFNEAARMTRQGKEIERGLSVSAIHMPLEYPGPRDIKKMENDPEFRDYRTVGVGTRRTPRCRPKFSDWRLLLPAVVLEDVLELAALKAIGERAGVSIGLGDGRTLGFGRFVAEITVKK